MPRERSVRSTRACSRRESAPSSRISPRSASLRSAAAPAKFSIAAAIDEGLALYASTMSVFLCVFTSCERWFPGSNDSIAAIAASLGTPK